MGVCAVRVRPAPPPTNARLPVLVLKLLKMATGMRALLDTVVQALPQVRRPLRGLAWVWLPCSQGGHHRCPQEDKTAGGPGSLVRHHSFTWSF